MTSLSLMLINVALLSLAYSVWRARPRSAVNASFAILCLTAGAWTIGIAGLATGNHLQFWMRVTFAAAALIPAAFYTFAISYHDDRCHGTAYVTWVIAGFFLTLALLDAVVHDTTLSSRTLSRTPGAAYTPFVAYFLTVCGASFFLLLRKWQRSVGRARAHASYLTVALLIAAGGGIVSNLILPSVTGHSTSSLIGPYFTFVALTFVAHAIIRHRAMDVTLVVRRGLTLSVATLISVIPVSLVLVALWPRLSVSFTRLELSILLTAMILASLCVPTIRDLVGEILDRYVYRSRIDFPHTIREASRAFTQSLELRRVIESAFQTLVDAVQPQEVAIYLKEDRVFKLYRSKRSIAATVAGPYPDTLPESVAAELETRKDFRLSQRTVFGAVVAEDGSDTARSKPLSSLVVPLVLEEKLLGAIAVGPKLSGDPYYPHDLDLLMTLANQAGIAIKNAQLYTEVVLANEYITNIVATIESGVVAVHSSGRVTMFNRAAEQLTGLAAGDVTGRQLAVLPAVLAGLLRRALETGHGHTEPEIELQADGALRPVICTTSPLRDPAGAILGAVAVFSDLTAVKELEAERRRAEQLAYVQLMASSLAHEIKNPLVAVKTFIQLLPRRAGDARFMEEFSRIVTREIGRMERLLDRLRVLSRPAERPRQPVEVQAPLAEAVEFLQPAFEQKRVALTVQAGSEPRRVLGDHSELEQLFINLLMNALEATPAEGRVEVTVAGSDDQVVVTVADSGPGIPPELLARVFDPFFTTKPRGSGLGLAISAGIARGHRAKLRASNRAGGGAVFTLEFPVMAPVERSQAEVDADG